MPVRNRFRRQLFASAALLAAPGIPASVRSQAPANTPPWRPVLLGAQVDIITQHLFDVPAAYSGPNSIGPNSDTQTSQAYGAYGGIRFARHLDVYVDVEMIRGAGVGRTVGLAGLTNGDVIRQGSADLGTGPYVARAYMRYTVPLSGAARDTLAAAPEQLATIVSSHRMEITAGKLALSDLFDLNRYANSTRTQFMNWGLFQNTAWDFAADTRGYSNGVAVAWITPHFALRAGSFQMPTRANGNVFDDDIRRAHGDQAELTVTFPYGTVARGLVYENHARMGNYLDAIARARATGTTPDIVADDTPGRTKHGFGLNVEQPLADQGETGMFARFGWNDGRNESFAFTEVDRHVSLGAQLSGVHWSRAADRVGLAVLRHDVVMAHRDYLAAGGLGFLLGDGALDYGPEQIGEAYYRFQIGRYAQLTFDVQSARNPGYNRARGPVTVLGARANLRY